MKQTWGLNSSFFLNNGYTSQANLFWKKIIEAVYEVISRSGHWEMRITALR